MKQLTHALAAMLVFAFTTPISAQTEKTNDVTVHPHNYKHPNKAAARPLRGIEFREGFRKAPTISDYKEQQRRGGQLNTTIAIPARDIAVSESRNYKQQNQNVKTRRKTDTQPAIEPVQQESIGN